MSQKININYNPGRHDIFSPVIGTRAEELRLLQEKIKKFPVLQEFESALHGDSGCSSSHFFLIPYEKRKEANAIAKRLFDDYLAPYAKDGITRKNAIEWVPSRYWGHRYGYSSPGLAILHHVDLRNGFGWHVHAVVNKGGGVLGEKYYPRHIVAYHEFQHVEEQSIEQSHEERLLHHNVELLPSLQALILVDQIYKQIHGIAEEEVVDYGKALKIGGSTLPVGLVANFYRLLARSQGSLYKAVASEPSLAFLSRQPQDDLPGPTELYYHNVGLF